MKKLLFLDQLGVDASSGFTRKLHQPRKRTGPPLLTADQPWEHGNMQLYGSVIHDGSNGYHLWYSTIRKPFHIVLCYAHSDDGFNWTRPALDLFPEKRRRTNIVLNCDVHGPAVILDHTDPNPDRRFKLVAGKSPSQCIGIFTSPDGIHWQPLAREPQLPFEPDSPMSFFRRPDGRYVITHRAMGWRRRICRSESWNLKTWSSEPRMILEPGPADPPHVQFYGMGTFCYGDLEMSTLWIFHTDTDEPNGGQMCGYQDAELAYSRSGHAWHRVAPDEPFIPHGAARTWDRGNLQCASQPVLLDDEIRFYYVGTNVDHASHWELLPQQAALGVATIKPDRFVGMHVGERRGVLVTELLRGNRPAWYVNAKIQRGGELRAALLDANRKPLPGCHETDCQPVTGDHLAAKLTWRKSPTPEQLKKGVRLRVTASKTALFSIAAGAADETYVYHHFESFR